MSLLSNTRINCFVFHQVAVVRLYLQVTYLAVTSGRDLAEKSRNIVKKLMTDTVQSLYNYEGRGMKQKKPLKTLTQIISLIYGTQNAKYFAQILRMHSTDQNRLIM
jgi:hypothetical protein